MNSKPPDQWNDDQGQQPYSQEWDLPAGPDPNLRAAVFVWIVGAMETVCCGCFATSLAILSTFSLEEIQQYTNQPLPTEFPQFMQAMPLVAAGLLVMGFIPGVAYLLLGFGVRRGKPLAIRVALIMAITQMIVLAFLFLWELSQTAFTGNPVTATGTVLRFGTPMFFLGFAIRWLLAAQQRITTDFHGDEDSRE